MTQTNVVRIKLSFKYSSNWYNTFKSPLPPQSGPCQQATWKFRSVYSNWSYYRAEIGRNSNTEAILKKGKAKRMKSHGGKGVLVKYNHGEKNKTVVEESQALNTIGMSTRNTQRKWKWADEQDYFQVWRLNEGHRSKLRRFFGSAEFFYALIRSFLVSKASSSSNQELFGKLNTLYPSTCISLTRSWIFILIHDKEVWQLQTTGRCDSSN